MNEAERRKIDRAKAYLSRYLALTRRVVELSDRIEACRAIAQRCTSVLSWTPGGGNGHNLLEESVAQAAELEEELRARLGRIAGVCREIERAIATLPNESLRELLRMRFLCGYTLERTAEEMMYQDRRYISKLQNRALLLVTIPEKRAVQRDADCDILGERNEA